jgi:hypothetical protein
VAANNCFIILAEGGDNNNLFCRKDKEGENLRLSRFHYVYLDSEPLPACFAARERKELFRTDLRAFENGQRKWVLPLFPGDIYISGFSYKIGIKNKILEKVW